MRSLLSLGPVALLAAFSVGCASHEPEPKTAAASVASVDLEPKKPAGDAPSEDDPHAARAAAMEQAMEMGMIGLLSSGELTGTLGSADFDSELFDSGLDEGLAGLMGSDVAQGNGYGGLGLRGNGPGGGGTADGTIGLGSIGVIGKGGGGTGAGYGSGSGRLGGTRSAAPKVRMGAAEIAGSLPKEIIQRIVRQNFGSLRYCYEKALLKDPKIAGKVSTKFTISKSGAVAAAKSTSDMSDKEVATCVEKTFLRLSFPQPEKGDIVVVSYPIVFSPGDDDKASGAATAAVAKGPQIAGKSLAEVSAADLEKALKDAGYGSVSSADHPVIKGAKVISASKEGKQYVVSFVPASARVGTLPSEEQKRIESGAGMQQDGLAVAITGPDQASAKALLDAIVSDK